jgi:hypothetical protein
LKRANCRKRQCQSKVRKKKIKRRGKEKQVTCISKKKVGCTLLVFSLHLKDFENAYFSKNGCAQDVNL